MLAGSSGLERETGRVGLKLLGESVSCIQGVFLLVFIPGLPCIILVVCSVLRLLAVVYILLVLYARVCCSRAPAFALHLLLSYQIRLSSELEPFQGAVDGKLESK